MEGSERRNKSGTFWLEMQLNMYIYIYINGGLHQEAKSNLLDMVAKNRSNNTKTGSRTSEKHWQTADSGDPAWMGSHGL